LSPPPPPSLPVMATGDPHFFFPAGGGTDFRGVAWLLYVLLSSYDTQLTAMVENATHVLIGRQHRRVEVCGTFITQAHVTGGDGSVLSVKAANVGPGNNAGDGATNYSCAGSGTSDYMHMNTVKKCNEAFVLKMKYSTLTVETPSWVISIKTMPIFNRVSGPAHRLDLGIDPKANVRGRAHGILGQAFHRSTACEGKKDVYPEMGKFTTSAMAEGCIEGVASDYVVATAHATEFRYSQFKKDNNTTFAFGASSGGLASE